MRSRLSNLVTTASALIHFESLYEDIHTLANFFSGLLFGSHSTNNQMEPVTATLLHSMEVYFLLQKQKRNVQKRKINAFLNENQCWVWFEMKWFEIMILNQMQWFLILISNHFIISDLWFWSEIIFWWFYCFTWCQNQSHLKSFKIYILS